MKLTMKMVAKAKPPAKNQLFLRDTELRGFGLRIQAGGTKTYIVERKIEGRVRRITIGPASALTVEQARDIAKQKIGNIARGENPADAIREARAAWGMAELIDAYRERYLPRLDAGTQENEEGYLKNHLQSWRSRKLSAITRGDVAALHASIGRAHPFAANGVV